MSSSEAAGTLTDLHGNTQSAIVLDVAGFDVLLLIPSPVSVGSRLELSLKVHDQPEPYLLSGVVHWQQPRVDAWEIGIALPEPAPKELLFVAGGSSRDAIRYRSSIHGELWMAQDGQICRATALNYSRDGFCLSCEQQVESGSTVIFHWEDQTEDRVANRRSVSAHVRWSSDVAGSFLIGCDLLSGTRYALSGIDVDERIRKIRGRQIDWSKLLTRETASTP
ncbi:MAG: hypothetical protein JNM43_00470 [Planctomycetaceae bacterium]|nr:hypothetical protein [Planctomycetaceae bacterium]